MEIHEEARQAAEELGEALRNHPALVRYRQAVEAAQGDPAFFAMEAETQRALAELNQRQENGQAVPLADINAYYKMRQELVKHPLHRERQIALREARTVIEQAGKALNGVLTIDFSHFLE